MYSHSKAKVSMLLPWIQKHLQDTSPNDLPGATAAIIRHGKAIHGSACGLTDMRRGIPISIDCAHRIGALTKQFTAAAIMLLNERKWLSLDDALTTHLPDNLAQGHAVRLSHLLNHPAGVVCYTDGDDIESIESSELSGQQVLDQFQHAPLRFAPAADSSAAGCTHGEWPIHRKPCGPRPLIISERCAVSLWP